LKRGRVRIRRARAGDVDGMLALMRPYYAEDGYRFDRGCAAKVLRAFLRRPACGRAWVLTWEGRVSGYAVVTLGYSLEHGGRDAFLDEIASLTFERRAP
jgi:hypothetical protein